MSEIFDKLTSPQLTAVICTVAGVVALVVFIISIWSYQVRALAEETALQRERQNADIAMQKEQVQAEIAMKQELVKRNLPPEELRLVLETIGTVSVASPGSEEEYQGEEEEEEEDDDRREAATRVLKVLAVCDCGDNQLVEETVALVAAADTPSLEILAGVLEESAGYGHTGQTAFLLARSYCKSAAKKAAPPPAKPEPAAEPAAEKRPIDLQFERSFGAS
jgi:hypothetical protein